MHQKNLKSYSEKEKRLSLDNKTPITTKSDRRETGAENSWI